MPLEAHGLGYRIAGAQILNEISVKFAPGKLTAILGPNGAGKSTLLAALCGQIKPHQGAVWLNGKLLSGYRHADVARFRAFMPQDCSIAFDYLVHAVVELGRYPHRLQPSQDEAGIVNAALATGGVAHLAQRNFNTLSGGEKARTQLARALAQIWESPRAYQTQAPQRWLLLDEPTAALDLAHQHSVMRTIKNWACERGIGVVAVLHDLNLALRYADNVLVLQNGRMAAYGHTQHVLTPQLAKSVWQIDCESLIGTDKQRYIIAR